MGEKVKGGSEPYWCLQNEGIIRTDPKGYGDSLCALGYICLA